MDYRRFTRRGLLEHVAERVDALTKGQELLMALTTEEQTAVDNVTEILTTLTTDVGALKDDVVTVFQAKDVLIADLRQKLSDAQAEAGVSASKIAQDDAQIAQMQQSATDAANSVVGAFNTIADTARNADTVIGAAKTSIDATGEPAGEPPPDNSTPTDGSTPADTTTPADTAPQGDTPSP